MNFFKKIKNGFKKTQQAITSQIKSVVSGKKLDEDTLEELEEILITADLGVDLAMDLVERLRVRSKKADIEGDDVFSALSEELEDIFSEVTAEEDVIQSDIKPHVTFMVGVNGSGKTTTIGKLAHRYTENGQKVLIIAADTFRSAAVE